MCGVAGAYRPGSAPDPRRIDAMLDRIAHRGPDGRGLVEAGPVVLGHLRLSILDLSDRAAQPMASHDGRFLLTYNGEVYNFPELRERLAAAGVQVRSTGDTEVLLEHLVTFGVEDTLPRIEGFFAFALWDAREDTLTLARDRLGIKPMYWQVRDGEVRFASEHKALVDDRVRPDLTTLDAMLLGFSATWGRATPFDGVEALEAGSIVRFRGSTIPAHARWFSPLDLVDPDAHAELAALPEAEVVARFEAAFERSLHYRMVSDVPVASLVSGGVDSSLVTALAWRTEHPPDLYHADVVADSERPAAEALVDALGGSLRVATVTDETFLADVTRATWFNDMPLTYHVNAVPFLLVCERAGADHVKVLLSGEGSDEFFLGYPQYGLAPYLETIGALKGGVRGLAHRIAPRVVDQVWPRDADSYDGMLHELVSRAEEPMLERSALARADHLEGRAERRAHATSLSLVRSHLGSVLHRNDRLGMAARLENRFPFLGRDLTHLAINLPVRYKLRWTARVHDRRHPFVVDKWLVRHVATRHMPVDLARREKQGFPVKVQDRVRVQPALLVDGFVAEHWHLDPAAIAAIFEDASPLWMLRLALVEIWGRLFFGGGSIDEVTAHVARHTHLSTGVAA